MGMGKKMQMITDKELMSKIYKQQHNSISKNQTINQMTRLKNGQKKWIDTFFKGEMQMANRSWKDAQHH